MASNINETGIDELYPVAGIDNDSQGFRDNFSSIKSNFTVTKTEIEDLQNNAARTDEDVSFNGNEVSNAVFLYNTEKVFQAGTITNNQNVSLTNGPIQVIGVGASITLTLAEWPESGYSKIRLMVINIGSANKTLNFSVQGGGAIKRDPSWPTVDTTITVSDEDNFAIIDFFTIDGGTTVFAEYKGIYS
jgi:hypothetical protein